MRVGLYTDHLYSDGQIGTGVSKYIYYLKKELENLGVDVISLSKGQNPSNVDILHDPHAPWNIPSNPARPLVITIHDLAPATYPMYFNKWIRFLFMQRMKRAIDLSSMVITDSNHSKNSIHKFFKSDKEVFSIPLGVEEKFKVWSHFRNFSNPYILQVGIHHKIKEPWHTLYAFENIVNDIPHRLIFVGQSSLVNELKEYVINNSDLRERVSFIWPGENNLSVFYNHSSLVVHPCPEEGFGFVPIEALACGSHVLYCADAVKETVSNYGCMFDHYNFLSDKILKCLSEGPQGTALERSSHAHQFTFQKMALYTLQIYKLAVNGVENENT